MKLETEKVRIEKILQDLDTFFAATSGPISIGTTPVVISAFDNQQFQAVKGAIERIQNEILEDVIDDLIRANDPQIHGGTGPERRLILATARRILLLLNKLHDIWNDVEHGRIELLKISPELQKSDLVSYIATLRVQHQHMTTMCHELRSLINEVQDQIVTREDKNISDQHVFVGFQFVSSSYELSSLKTMMKEALLPLGLKEWFPDENYEPQYLMDEIVNAIRQSVFCVFEVSDSNPNVLLELGIALAFGKAVIIICRKGSSGTKISDLAGSHRVEYVDLVDCRDQLRNKFDKSATIQSLLKNIKI